MKPNEKDIARLAAAPVGHLVRFDGGVETEVWRATDCYGKPCLQCIYGGWEEQHPACPMSRACMGRWRKDRQSVTFRQVNKEKTWKRQTRNRRPA